MLKRIATILCCAALLLVVPVRSDEWNKKTTVTFGRPVELPGVVLPAGTYIFKLLDSNADRHIVRVLNADETKVLATILAIPNWRLTPGDKTTLSFEERPGNKPEALRAWFYPGDNFGQEFVYPKARAVQLAEATHVPVLTAAVTPTQKPEQLIEVPVIAVTPEKKEVEVAQVTGPPKPEPRRLVAQARPAPEVLREATLREVPNTVSQLPLMILLGACCFGIGFVLRAISGHID